MPFLLKHKNVHNHMLKQNEFLHLHSIFQIIPSAFSRTIFILSADFPSTTAMDDYNTWF